MESPLKSKRQKRAHKVCAVCGKNAHHTCTFCKDDKHKDGVPLHKPPTSSGEMTCFCQCHNTLFHELAESDSKLVGCERKDHCHPTAETVQGHADSVKQLREHPVSQLTTRIDNDENVDGNIFWGWGAEHAML